MFTIDQIKEAHAKVKSGADFPAYIQALIRLGVTNYSTYVNDGHTEFHGKNNYHIQSDAKYTLMNVSEKSDAESFRNYLKNHQQGQSDYPAFCGQSAETGVEKWEVDLSAMTCIYYDKTGNKMLTENIPQV